MPTQSTDHTHRNPSTAVTPDGSSVEPDNTGKIVKKPIETTIPALSRATGADGKSHVYDTRTGKKVSILGGWSDIKRRAFEGHVPKEK